MLERKLDWAGTVSPLAPRSRRRVARRARQRAIELLEWRRLLAADVYSTSVNTTLHAGLANGTFETDNIAPWISYTTPDGSIGGAGFPNVVLRDTDGDGFLSAAAQFRVANGGGGIRQNVFLSDRTISLSVDVAATSRYADPDGGVVEVWLGPRLVARHEFGALDENEFKRQTLAATVTGLTPGWHELRLEITRTSPTSSIRTSQHFVDNWRLSGDPLGVLANDGLPTDGAHRPLLVEAPDHGDIELRADGSFRYQPKADFVGEDSFSYVPAEAASGVAIYSVDTATDTLVKIDSVSGAVTTVGAIGRNMGQVDLAYDQGTLFATNWRGQTFELLTLDPTTGAMLTAVPLRFNEALRTVKGMTAVDGRLYVIFSYAAGYCGDACGAAHVLGRLNPATGQLTELVNYRDVGGGFNHDFDALATDSQGRLLGHRFAEGAAIQTYVLGFSPPSLQHIGEAYPPGVSVNDAVFVGDQHYLLSQTARGFYRYDPVAIGYATIAEAVTIGAEATSLSGMAFAVDHQPGVERATIRVTAEGSPEARNDAYLAVEDQSLVVTAAHGLLANDDPLQPVPTAVEITRGPFHGSLTIAQDGSFQYVPEPHFFGEDIFQYQRSVADTRTNVATVTIRVDAVADAPIAADDAIEVIQNQQLVVSALQGVLSNDYDADGDHLTTVLVTAPAHGELRLYEDGSLEYEPAAGFVGTDQFTYRVTDGMSSSNIATVRLNVIPPPPPVAVADVYTVTEDGILDVAAQAEPPNIPGVLANDFGYSGGALTAELVDDVAHGQLDFRANGSFLYRPSPDFSGSDRFTYRVHEGAAASEAVVVQINVLSVDDPPRGEPDRYQVTPSRTLRVDAAAGVLANDSDPEGDRLTAVLVSGPQSGTLLLRSDGSFDYRPGPSFQMTDQFVYQAAGGGQLSEPVTVTLQADLPRIVVGEHHLRPNQAHQSIRIFVQGGHAVAGTDLYAMVGDGGPERTQLGLPPGTDGPAITHVDLKTGTIFSSLTDEASNLGSIPQVANWSIANTGGGTVAADGLLVTLTIDTTGFLEGSWSMALGSILPEHVFGPFDTGFAGELALIENGTITIDAVEVVGRHLFYNNSAWDGGNPSANANDDLAIAPDKLPLIAGRTATFANYSSYSRGINGVIIDVARLPASNAITINDFTFRVGRSNDPAGWAAAPTPQLSVRPSAGKDGSDRITLVWPDGVIAQNWLEVELRPSPRNLLPAADRFYFGNAIGETGDSPVHTLVNAVDVIATRDNQRGPFNQATLVDPFDFNRDRLVTATDVILARDHQLGLLLALPLITPQPRSVPALAFADLNSDGELNAGDIDFLSAALRARDADRRFDLDNNSVNDSSDYAMLVDRILAVPRGDVTLDGVFDSSDLVAVFQSGKYEATSGDHATWAEGDWNGDGLFTSADLVLALQQGKYRGG